MKKFNCIFFTAVFVLGLLMVTTNAQATEVEVPKIQLSGLIEVGAVWQDIDYDAAAPEEEDHSDICLTTVELTAEAEINEWVNVAATLLYEDPTFGEETSVDIDVATVTIGNTEEYPLYCTAGKMYVPFGALLTHFPDDPLIDAPNTLMLGETLEKALLVGMEHGGFSVAAYAFNGDVDEFGEDNNVESYGVDVNFAMDEEEDGVDLLIGASYISNITEADYFSEALEHYVEELEAIAGVLGAGLKDYVAGVDGYVHVGLLGFFVDAEYMTALDDVDATVDTAAFGEVTLKGDQPMVYNIEAGYNWDWGKNLEIVLNYAASDEADFLGIPETRYGVCLNQDIFENVVVSLGYLRDDYDEDEDVDGRDQRDLVFAQIAVAF